MVASSLTWLDYSEAHQQKVRSLVSEWNQSETVDDLGIGVIRDGISNTLFPGVSVIQTRAKYFLFVPWIYRHAEKRFRTRLLAKAQDMERKLIPALRAGALAGGTPELGIIGATAGEGVKTLPSAIYWNGLARWGIFLRPGLTGRQYERVVSTRRTELDVEDEMGERTHGFWDPELPDPPEGFFDFVEAQIRLSAEEAAWLSERMLGTATIGGANLPNLLVPAVTHLKRGGSPAELDTSWGGPAVPQEDTKDSVARLVWHAERFSLAIEGASLLYNLVLCENREDAGIDVADAGTDPDTYRTALESWADRGAAAGLSDWGTGLDELWSVLAEQDVLVPGSPRRFVQEWCSLLETSKLGDLADDEGARRLVCAREIAHKRGQSRLRNTKRLRSYSGYAGTGALVFRWPTVRSFLEEIDAASGGGA